MTAAGPVARGAVKGLIHLEMLEIVQKSTFIAVKRSSTFVIKVSCDQSAPFVIYLILNIIILHVRSCG